MDTGPVEAGAVSRAPVSANGEICTTRSRTPRPPAPHSLVNPAQTPVEIPELAPSHEAGHTNRPVCANRGPRNCPEPIPLAMRAGHGSHFLRRAHPSPQEYGTGAPRPDEPAPSDRLGFVADSPCRSLRQLSSHRAADWRLTKTRSVGNVRRPFAAALGHPHAEKGWRQNQPGSATPRRRARESPPRRRRPRPRS